MFACSAENPLAVGLAAVAIGALLGLSSRSTTWETQFFGEHVSNYSTRYRILPMN